MLEKVENFKWEPGTLIMHMGFIDADFVRSVPVHYKANYQKDWFNDPFNVKVVSAIDKTEMILPGVFDSPWLGNIGHNEISGGAKALILLNMLPNVKVPLSSMGDNCADLLYELSLKKPLNIVYEDFLMKFKDEQNLYDTYGSWFMTSKEAVTWKYTYAPLVYDEREFV